MEIYNEDCLIGMKKLADNSVDMMFADLPYGITRNEWDIKIDLKAFWKEVNRVCKSNAAKVFTGAQPFTTEIINSNIKDFKYTMVWVKNRPTGIVLANKRPMRKHEDILVFYSKQPTYNKKGEKYKRPRFKQTQLVGSNQDSNSNINGYKTESPPRIFYEYKNKDTVLFFDQSKAYGNTTSKPVGLIKHLIESYTKQGDLVLDPVTGSGTTAIAAFELDRDFIGFEINKKQYENSLLRIKTEVF